MDAAHWRSFDGERALSDQSRSGGSSQEMPILTQEENHRMEEIKRLAGLAIDYDYKG